MTISDVPRSQWGSFFERFSHEHRAWLGTIHIVENGEPCTHLPSTPLRAISNARGPAGADVALSFADGLTLFMPKVAAVRVQSARPGAERALELENGRGTFLRLSFRAAARPEEVDGVSAVELMTEPAHAH